MPRPDFKVGEDNPNVLLVGACPGEDEEKKGRPFSGPAGKNLAVMLQKLHALHPDIFPSDSLDDYSLINAHSLPRYPKREGYDGRTQPTQDEVLADENRSRFTYQVKSLEPLTIVYLGKVAEYAHEMVEAAVEGFQAFKMGHPSAPAWNTKRKYAGKKKEDKLGQWAKDTLEQVT